MSFIHPQAVVEGDVKIGKNVTLCATAVLRGDEGQIVIGDNSNVQEGCVLHAGAQIGNNVSVGHGAIVHGCKIGNNVVVGMNATVLDGVIVGDDVIIAAGSVVPPRKTIEPNSMVMGVPGKVVRQLTEDEKKYIVNNAKMYVEKVLPKKATL
ncbi:MAG TPA: gamma carbonic anhydrase family protein [archaeon]|nr:gamma carbonic anhydrase family protein [archaeon]